MASGGVPWAEMEGAGPRGAGTGSGPNSVGGAGSSGAPAARDASSGGAAEPIRYATRGDFVGILDRLGLSLVAAAHPNRVVFLGAADGRLTAHEALVNGPMGLDVDAGRLAIATAHSIIVLGNAARLAPLFPPRPAHYDACFVPRTIHLTGGCETHDIALAGPAVIAANTAFSCVCRIDGQAHFTPLWWPPFVTQLRPEDRCHLNGFVGEGAELSYVTALAPTDTPRGWRENRYVSGVLIDARRNAVLRSGLCMPHSPRLVGRDLYVLNGGEGEVLRVDRGTGESAVVARLPGFTHGLCHHGGVLFVGMSKDRISRTNADAPPVAARFPSLVCGIAAVDVRSGRVLGAVEFDGLTEVFDVRPLPGVRRAMMQSLVGADEHHAVETPEAGFWMPGPGTISDAAATGNYQVRLDITV